MRRASLALAVSSGLMEISARHTRSTFELELQRALEGMREPPPPPAMPERPVFHHSAPKPRNPRVAGADIRRFIPRRTA